jgi:hypothetical protein
MGNTKLNTFLAAEKSPDLCYKTDEFLTQGITVAKQYNLAEFVTNAAVKFKPVDLVFLEGLQPCTTRRTRRLWGGEHCDETSFRGSVGGSNRGGAARAVYRDIIGVRASPGCVNDCADPNARALDVQAWSSGKAWPLRVLLGNGNHQLEWQRLA